MKKYRVDTFKNNQYATRYYDTESEARESIKKGDIAFLLQLIECIEKYDVVCQL